MSDSDVTVSNCASAALLRGDSVNLYCSSLPLEPVCIAAARAAAGAGWLYLAVVGCEALLVRSLVLLLAAAACAAASHAGVLSLACSITFHMHSAARKSCEGDSSHIYGQRRIGRTYIDSQGSGTQHLSAWAKLARWRFAVCIIRAAPCSAATLFISQLTSIWHGRLPPVPAAASASASQLLHPPAQPPLLPRPPRPPPCSGAGGRRAGAGAPGAQRCGWCAPTPFSPRCGTPAGQRAGDSSEVQ